MIVQVRDVRWVPTYATKDPPKDHTIEIDEDDYEDEYQLQDLIYDYLVNTFNRIPLMQNRFAFKYDILEY